MYSYGKTSRRRLVTCHPDLITIAEHVIRYRDATVICGHRGEIAQQTAFGLGNSRVEWPNSKHNSFPSVAIDFAPWPFDWNDAPSFRYFAGYVVGVADMLFEIGAIKHRIRWGGDWDMDNDLSDNTFNDLVHFELYKPEA